MRVLVHFFKPSGKWYTAEEVAWPYLGSHENPYPYAEVIEMHTRGGFRDGSVHRYAGFVAVCTETNPLGFPQSCVVPE